MPENLITVTLADFVVVGGHVECLDYLLKLEPKINISKLAIKTAIEKGRYSIIDYYAGIPKCKEPYSTEFGEAAIKSRSLEMIQLVHKYNWTNWYFLPIQDLSCLILATHNLDILNWFVDELEVIVYGDFKNEHIAKFGSVEIFKMFESMGRDFNSDLHKWHSLAGFANNFDLAQHLARLKHLQKNVINSQTRLPRRMRERRKKLKPEKSKKLKN